MRSRRCFPDVIADAADHVCRAIGVADDLAERLSDLAQVRRQLVRKIQVARALLRAAALGWEIS